MPAFDKAILKHVSDANRRYGLIEPGDRILLAVSGGKDSTTLAWAMNAFHKVAKFDYELQALHISSDFCACCKKSALKKLLAEWNIPFDDLFVPIIGRLKEGQPMNCWWCSTLRRTELLREARERGCNKIALGHHLDDIVETFFMNMTAKGELSTMPARLSYTKYPVSIIRPLALVEERQIIGFADSAGFRSSACTCPYGANSKRRDMRERIKVLTGGSSGVKRRIFESMSNVKADYLGGVVLPGTEDVPRGEG